MRLTVILFISLIYSCTNNLTEDYTNKIASLLQQKNTDSLDIAVTHQLKIFETEHNIAAYINLCAWVNDSLTTWKQKSASAKFAMLAASKESFVLNDSSLKNKIGDIAYKTTLLIFNLSYSDTCVTLAETAYRNTSSLPLKNTLCNFLGIMYHVLGDKTKAAMYYNLCYKSRLYVQQTNTSTTLTQRNKSLAAVVNNQLTFFNEYGQYDSTILYAEKALLLDSLENKRIALIKAALAEALYKKGKKEKAAQSINESLQLLQQLPSNEDILERKRDVLRIKGLLQFNNNNTIEALITFYSALDTAFKKNRYSFKDRNIGKVCIDIAKAYQRIQQIDSALLYTHKALYSVTDIDSANLFSLPALSGIYRENTILESCDAMADILKQKYLLNKDTFYIQQAIRCYAISFAAEAKLMEHFINDDSRLFMLNESKTRSQKAIDICYTLYNLTKNNTFAEKALEFAEKSKSIVMLESIKKNIAANNTLANDDKYKTVQKLQLQVAAAGKEIYEIHLAGRDSAIQLLEQKKRQLENDLQFAKTDLINTNSAYRFITQSNTQFTLQDIQKKLLNNETALVEYFYDDSATYLFYAGNKNSLGFYKLTDSLYASVQNMLYNFTSSSIITNNPLQYNRDAYKLYTQLQLPNISTNIHKLIIIPDGIISSIPFDALLTKPYNSSVIKAAPFFIKNIQSSYGYSAATLLQQPAFKQAEKNIVAFAPVFINGERKMKKLAASETEINVMRNEWPEGKYFTGKQATLQNFRSNISTADIIHIATHATTGIDKKELPHIEFIDSSLTLDELYAYNTNASLVVLSACETGIGNINKSEGAMSIARGFYYAGVKNIITSLWNINDKSTSTLMQYFYTNIQHNNYAGALQKAKLDYISNAGTAEVSPYYWASFIQIGTGKSTTSTSWIWYFLIIPLGYILLFFYKKTALCNPCFVPVQGYRNAYFGLQQTRLL